MLSTPTRDLLDRLAAAVMVIVDAVAPRAAASTPTLPEAAAETLFFRLCRLVTTLIRISAFGLRTTPKPAPKTRNPPAARPTRTTPTPALPRRPGWLLAALPEIAPAVAADISALLDDPAIAALLERAPSLHRILRPLLRSLGLAQPRPKAPRPRSPTAAHPTKPASLSARTTRHSTPKPVVKYA